MSQYKFLFTENQHVSQIRAFLGPIPSHSASHQTLVPTTTIAAGNQRAYQGSHEAGRKDPNVAWGKSEL